MASNNSMVKLLFTPDVPTSVIEQYYANLSVCFFNVRKNSQQHHGDTVERIESLITADKKSWLKAYEIEKLLILLNDEHSIEPDLKNALLRYRLHFSENESKHYEDLIASAEEQDLDKKRAILLRILNELHLFYMKRSEHKDYGILARARVSFAFILGFILFILSLVHYCHLDIFDTSSKIFIISIVSGYLGATFSLLVSLKSVLATSTMEDLKIIHRHSYIFKRAFIGVGGALILYFLVQANLIEGGLFPNLPVISSPNVADTYRQISMVITWSIVAGFTEMLVPKLLKKTEVRVKA